MADYFEEMGWTPLGPGQTPDQLLHMARLLRDFGMWEMLGQGQKLSPPASKVAVENLQTKAVDSSGNCEEAVTFLQYQDTHGNVGLLDPLQTGEKCPVCLKEFDIGETVKIMPCKHTFHSSCIVPWLERTNSCPLCRHELPTDDEEYEMYRKEKMRAKQREADIETLHNSMFT